MEDKKEHKIGIVCNNYKVEKFKKELAKKDFKDIECVEYGKTLTLIKVITPEENNPKVAAICQLVEAHFHRSN